MVPIWVTPEQWKPLNPPAIVMKLGDMRSPENLLAASRALKVTEARRYLPDEKRTWCNIYAADVCNILKAPLPHDWDLEDGLGRREMRANDIYDGLKKGKFPGWAMVGTIASESAILNLATVGVPQVAVWRNPKGPGHIVLIVPTPKGKTGIYVTGAGRKCVQECPLSAAFPPALIPAVDFYHFTR